MTALFDTHCHIQDDAFGDESLEAVGRAHAAGVAGMTVCGWDEASNTGALELAGVVPGVFPAVGFHPHEAKTVSVAMLAQLESLARLPQVVALGEVGLDFYRDHSPREVQRHVLDEQLAIAVRVGKPVLVHSRAAEGEIYDHLARYAAATPLTNVNRPVGVMHCFGGTIDQADRYVKLGFLVSIAGSVTYPKNDEARRLAAAIPLEWLVVETDSPYLAPQPRRGRRNEPALLHHTVAAVAEARKLGFEVIAHATTDNARRLFNVELPAAVAA